VLKWEILWEIEQFESYQKVAALQFKMVGVRPKSGVDTHEIF
jgi:hypothetical protein